MNNEIQDEVIDEGGMLVRDAVQNLKEGKTAFCYKEWQIEEIKTKLKTKYGKDVKAEKKDGWYWVLHTVK